MGEAEIDRTPIGFPTEVVGPTKDIKEGCEERQIFVQSELVLTYMSLEAKTML